MTARKRAPELAPGFVFTYFAPRNPLPAQRLDDRAYAAKHAQQTTPTEVCEVGSLDDLRRWARKRTTAGRKGDAGYIVAGECPGPRDGDNAGPASFALIDYDGAEPDWKTLDEYEGFAWTTANHTPEQPRWRVVIPFTKPAAHGKLECPFAGGYIRNRSQPAFLPTQAESAPPVEWRTLAGAQRLDAERLGSAPARRQRSTRPAAVRAHPTCQSGAFAFDTIDLSAIARHVPPPGHDGDRHLLVRGLGGWLARRGYDPEAIAEAVRLQIPSSDPAERAAQAEDAAERVRRGLDAPGWEALSQWAERYADGHSTLGRLAKACRDPREPEGFGDVWSEWWARVWPKMDARFRAAHAANDTGIHGEVDGSGLHLRAATGWPWILQRGSTYWLHARNEQQYGRQFPQAELETRAAHDLAGLLSEEDRKPSALRVGWTRAVDRVVYSYTELVTTYVPDRNCVRVAALDRMPSERATFHAAIDLWLRALFGASYARGAQWLASCASLDRPAPCLYLIGPRELGKSLLFDGIARLWGCSSPVPMGEIVADFNEKQCECPLVVADEGLPSGLEFSRFRRVVTEHDRSVNRKNLAKVDVEGCARVAIGANNSGVLRWARHGELAQSDQDAITDRLLVIECGAEARGALHMHPASAVATWATHEIAEHVLWLAKTVSLEQTGRMCVLPHGGEPLVRAVLNDRYAPIALAIVDALNGGGITQREAHVWRCKKDDRVIFVHAEQLHAWMQGRDRRLYVGDVRDACKALARLGGAVTTQQRLPGSKRTDRRPRVYELDSERVGEAAGLDVQ